MQSCAGPSTSSGVNQQRSEVKHESSVSQSQSSAAGHQTDLRKWQSTSGAKSSQSQYSDVRSSQQQQQQADVKRKLPEWMNSASGGKAATKKKLKNSSLFS